MPDPVLHLIAGPNGAGKSTLYERVVGPVTHLEFVNADALASMHWPDDPMAKSYEASALAAQHRTQLITARTSFATETVFSHLSKLEILEEALGAGYLVTLHVVMVPESLAVARVAHRVAAGGHVVPEVKVRQRFQRLWPLVANAILVVDSALMYDNSATTPPFRIVARFDRGAPVRGPDWPPWTPDALLEATR